MHNYVSCYEHPTRLKKKKKEGPLCSSPMDILGCGQREVERMRSVHYTIPVDYLGIYVCTQIYWPLYPCTYKDSWFLHCHYKIGDDLGE